MDNVMLLVIHSQRRSRQQIKEFRFNFCNLSKSVVYASLFLAYKTTVLTTQLKFLTPFRHSKTNFAISRA